MIEKIVDINVSGKEKMPTFVVYPSDDNIYPVVILLMDCLLYTSPSPRDRTRSRMPSSA